MHEGCSVLRTVPNYGVTGDESCSQWTVQTIIYAILIYAILNGTIRAGVR